MEANGKFLISENSIIIANARMIHINDNNGSSMEVPWKFLKKRGSFSSSYFDDLLLFSQSMRNIAVNLIMDYDNN